MVDTDPGKTTTAARRRRRWPRLGRAPTVTWALLLGALGSAALTYATYRVDERERRAEFAQAAANRVASLRRSVETLSTDLLALRAFFEASDQVDRREFHTFVDALWASRREPQALGWAPRLLDAQGRESFPVRYVEPDADGAAALGLDLASGAEGAAALRRALATQALTATARVALPGERGRGSGVLVLVPVRDRRARPAATAATPDPFAGVVVGAYRPGDLLERAFGFLEPEPVDVAVYDDSEAAGERLLAAYSSRTRAAAETRAPPPRGALESTEPLRFADRTWRIVFTSAAGAGGTISHAWLALALGLAFTALLAAYPVGYERRVRGAIDREAMSRQLELIRHNANDMLLLTTRDGAILEANPRALEAFGYSSEEMLRLRIRDLRAPELRGELDRQLEQVFDGGGLRYTTLNRRRDGSIFPVEVNARPLVIGARRLLLAFVRDLTEERATRAASDYQAMLLENLHDAVIGTDVAFVITAWNRAAEAIYGWRRDEAVGRGLHEVLSPQVIGTPFEEVAAEVARAGRVRVEARHRARDGRWVDVETTIVALRGPDGALIGRVSVNRDISRRKRDQAALRAGEERLARILETCGEGICVVDASGRTEYANARAAALFGLPAEELSGRPFAEVLPEALRVAMAADLPRFARGESVQRELRWKGPGGCETCVMLSSSALRDAGGSLAGTVGVFMDVTDHRRAEQELQQAQKSEAVGRLAAGIAHEMNTPIQFIGDNAHFLGEALAALTGLLQRYRAVVEAEASAASRGALERAAVELELDYFAEEAPKTIARTLEGVRRVATLVRAMKEFAHPDQKEMVATDLNRALLATLEVARNEYKYVADVHTDLGAIPRVTCHAGDLNQVFLNIVVNAAHAIEDAVKGSGGRGAIRIATRQEGPQVVVAISDSGNGIPEAIREKVFDPFFTTKEVGRGTGQGLAIARSIVAKHRGHLTFTSATGQGTTFEVRVPIEPAPARTDRRAPAA